jgi:2-keto-3-deoxy-L-rhamnonate aldolase RhmA
MLTINSPEVVELLAGAGFDWLFIDCEHAPLSIGGIQSILQAAGPDMPCLVRLLAAREEYVKQALDVGAAGIIVPQVNSAIQAEQIVRWAKFAPEGSRGVGINRANRYSFGFQEYIDSANDCLAIVLQAEHIKAVENIASIVRVEGVDAIFVGPYDLSSSMGKLGQVDDAEVVEAIDQVSAVCREAGMPLGIFGLTAASVTPYIQKGFTLITAGIDTTLLGQSARDLLTKLKQNSS